MSPFVLVVAIAAARTDQVRGQEPGDLFERVVETLEARYWDRTYRRKELPKLAAKFRAAAEGAKSLAEECAVVDGMLSHIPASHLALYSERTHRNLIDELRGRRRPQFGFQVKQKASRFFACKILEGGPAEKAGLRRGDRIVSIAGVASHASGRLDRRSDDAYLPDAPLHAVIARDEDDAVELVVERRLGGPRTKIRIEAEKYCAVLAARASARVIEVGERRVGYVHFWYIHAGCVSLLRKLAKDEFRDCDSLVLDLRGRGGIASEAQRIVRFFAGSRAEWKRPFVALMDRESRSAKEMLAYDFQTRKIAKIFGEKSAGALVPAMFARVGQGMVLMYPSFRIGKYSRDVELDGIEPDVPVAYPLPYTAGKDPVRDAAVEYLTRRANGPRSPAP